MSLSTLDTILSKGRNIGAAIDAFNNSAETVDEVAPHFTGGAAASIAQAAATAGQAPVMQPMFPGSHPVPGSPATGWQAPFYVPPVQVSEEELRTEAEIRAKFLLSKLRLGSGIVRNMAAEIFAKAGDEQLVDDWHRAQTGSPPAGSMTAKAEKRLKVRARLKNYQSSVITDDDNELVDLMKEALFIQMKEDVQAGTFRRIGFEGMVSRLLATELFGLAEAIIEPVTDLIKDKFAK